MKSLEIKTINLLKFYVIIVSSILVSIIISFLINILFFQNPFFFIFISIILAIPIIYFSESYSKKNLRVQFKKEVFIIENNLPIEYTDIEIIMYKYQWRNFPYLKIKLINNRNIKIRSSEKVNDNLEKLTSTLESKIN